MKKWIILVLVAVIAIAWSLADRSDEASPKEPFRVAFNTWLGYSPLVMADELGYLKEVGLDVEITFLEGIGEKNAALLRGEIDGVGHTADSAVTSEAAGVDGQIVFVFDRSMGADGILAKKTIRTVGDLAGRTVALEPGFTGHFFFLFLLDSVGLGPDDVDVLPMDTGSAGSAFLSGSVDAAVTWEPWIGRSKEREDAHILVTSADEPGVIIDVLYMRRDTIRRRRDDVSDLVAAMGRATEWYAAHPDEGNQIMARFWKLDLTEVEETVAGMEFMSIEENVAFFGTNSEPGQLLTTVQKSDELWRKAGVTKRAVDARGLIDFASIREAGARGPE